MAKSNECIIPEPALTDPQSREILRAWVAQGGLHVSLWIPEDWQDPATWGIALTDVIRHLADDYHQSRGWEPDETIRRIQEGIVAELSSPTDEPTGGFVDQ